MAAVLFPHLGFAAAEGTILRWLREVGDSVEAGMELVEVASEKAINVVVAPEAGTLLAVYAPPGAVVPEGEQLGWIGEAHRSAPPYRTQWKGWEEEIAPAPPGLAGRLAPGAEGAAGTGPAPEPFPPFHPPARIDKRFRNFLKSGLRAVTGRRMARSWVEKPKVDLFAEINFSRVVAHRQAEKDAGRTAAPVNVYIVHAVAKAFQEHPGLNCLWLDGRRVAMEEIHVGVAVALGENLLTISIKELGGCSLREIERRYKSLIRKAAGMTLQRDELYGSSLTVTNLGEFEIFAFTPIINPPEVFILAIGELKERAVVIGGEIVVAPVCYFCLAFDHRGVDGAPASMLLRSIKHHLEDYRDEP